MLSLGSFPEVSLASARTKRDDARKLLAEGKDPSKERKENKLKSATAAQNTFGLIAKELIAKLEAEGKSPATLAKQKWFLEDLASELTKRPITEITPAEVLVILRKAEQRGRRETARRLRGAIGRVFRYGIATIRANNDPTFALRGALAQPVVTPRAAITDEVKLGALMASIDEYDGWPTIRASLQFVALTMARPGEVRFMRKSEVNFIKKIWSIPAERMKMRRPHDVPLSNQALDVLRSVWEAADSFVFPSLRSTKKSLSENALNSALRRMGYTKEEMTTHGFRASASTILNARRYNRDVIETALAHLDENEIRRAYNRYKYWDERVVLLQDWANLLDQLKTKTQALSRA
jgi:integrase